MELKRILARDTRSATEKAISLYGPDVLVISNHQVGGQTELVVALDVPTDLPAAPVAQPQAATQGGFRQSFFQAQQQLTQPPPAAATAPADAEPEMPAAQALARAHARASARDGAEAEARDLQRGREIVDLVRDEIAALRREFRLSQQAAAWQGGLQLHPSLAPLAQALADSGAPTALRTLLMDALDGEQDPARALATWTSQLTHTLARPQAELPTQGVHVLAGPSGGGKTLMCARLARHASGVHGPEAVAVISYRDQRAGAWSQTQMLGAQLGIDCFRASDEEALRLLLSELSTRALVLVDTPGVQMAERLAEVQGAFPQARLHAVVPADASAATLRRVLELPQVAWHSIMPSKLDESSAPWPLVERLSNNGLPLSCASDGSRMSDLIHAFTVPHLIALALEPLGEACVTPDAADAALAGARPMTGQASAAAA